MSKKITRRIRFYAIDWIKTDGSHVGKDSAFLTQILKKNRKADYRTDEQVIISESTDIKLPNISDSAWVLSRIRKSDFPQTSDMNGERVQALIQDENIWLTQKSMAELFGCTPDNISQHLRNIFNDGELLKDSVTEKFSATASDGKNYLTQF